MSSARNEILEAIRGGTPDADAIAAQARRLRAGACRPERVNGPADVVFLERLRAPGIAATAERVLTMQDFPDAVRRYLTTQQLAPTVALQPHAALQALNWAGIETHAHIGTDELVAVGLALGGIAETGSLVFHSGPASPTLFAFLPLHHIVAVRASTIWPWLEDYADAVSDSPQPRNVNLITGASGTTDIEGTLVRGAHGPGWLHVVLVGDARDAS
ncbi:MAG: hypothetical protein B7X08_05620 [Acidocella sp. 20-63-7]|nr:MAG: hypothetical protein B7X08_05620 [Acidocella sp. 20-63-7]HQT46902.1 LUD domain-containing protein [Acidocella sp.]